MACVFVRPIGALRRRFAIAGTFVVLTAIGPSALLGQAPDAAPTQSRVDRDASDDLDVSAEADEVDIDAMSPVASAATRTAPDPALVYVPPTAQAVLTAELSGFGDDEALHPLYRVLLQGVLSTAPIPPERLEDLERLTLFVVPYVPGDSMADVADIVTTPGAYLAQTSLDSTGYGYGFVLHFAEPIYERDLRQVLGPAARRVDFTLIPTFRVGGSVVRLLENRYVLVTQNELPATIVPFLDRDAYARTPGGERLAKLRVGESLRARAVVSGSLVRRIGSTYLTGDDAYLFQTFWNDRVEAWTLQFDVARSEGRTAYVVQAMMQTDREATASALEEDLVGVVRLALAAARDYSTTFSTGEGAAVDPVALVAASTFESMLSERRLFVGHIDAAAGIQAVLTPEDVAEIPSMLGRLAGAANAQADALAEDRARQRRVIAALLAYRDSVGAFLPPVVFDSESGEARSWRVELLPYLGEGELFERYRTDEPWDSPHNEELLSQIPDVYRSSFDRTSPPSLAVAALVHPQGLFSPDGPVAAGQLLDPASTTMLIASVRLPIPWTRPQDIDALGTEELNDLAWTDAGVLAGFADGRVHLLQGVDPETLRSLVIRDDGKPFSEVDAIPGIEVDPEPAPEAERLVPPANAEPATPDGAIPPPLKPAPNPFADPAPPAGSSEGP